MTERHKQIAIIGGTFVAVIFLLLFLRRGSGAGAGATVGGSDWTLPTVTGPSLGPIYFGDGGGSPIVIPGLNLGGPDLSMIGACCSDCGQSQQPTFTQRSAATYIFNAGNNGPNVYNYSAIDARHDGIDGNAAGVLASTGSYFYSPWGRP